MKYRNWTSWILAAVATPVFLACSQGAGEPTDSVGQTLEPAADQAAKPARRGFGGDPAKLVERLDKDQNGTLEVAELPDHKRAHLAAADSNKDGRLTATELTAHAGMKKRERFGRQDTNKDGFLNADEVGERRWARLSVADADKDNRISFDEMGKAMAEHEVGFGRGRRGGFGHADPAKWLKKLDANGDGKAELSELPEHKRDRLQGADTNHDNAIDAAELKTFFESRRKSKPKPPASGGVL